MACVDTAYLDAQDAILQQEAELQAFGKSLHRRLTQCDFRKLSIEEIGWLNNIPRPVPYGPPRYTRDDVFRLADKLLSTEISRFSSVGRADDL